MKIGRKRSRRELSKIQISMLKQMYNKIENDGFGNDNIRGTIGVN